MATINPISKIKLPNNNTEYTIKDNSKEHSQHNHFFEDIKPIISKTYASTSYYATAANYDTSTWYFFNVKPDGWYKPWTIKFKIHSFCPAYENVNSTTEAIISGRADSTIYQNWNENYNAAHYYTMCRPLKQAGFNAGLGHAVGITIYSGTNYTNSAYYRTFVVELYETENCTVTALNTPVLWANWTNGTTTNYNNQVTYNAVSRGLQENGDADTLDNALIYFGAKTGSIGIWAGSLFMEDSNGTYQNICTASDGTVTSGNRTVDKTKKANPNGFKVGSNIYYSTTNYNANTNISGWAVVHSMHGNVFDSRYALNTELVANSLTPYKPLYLVGTIKSDGLYYLDETWWTQTPTNTAKIYVLIGGVYDSTTSYCRIVLYEDNPWYYYDGSKLMQYSGAITKISTGIGLTGGDITTNGTIKAKLKTETAHTIDSASQTNTSNRQYAIGVDKSGYLSVNVPWQNTTYTAATAAPGKIASASAQGTSTNYARQDHTHGIDLATGDNNGQVKIAGQNVDVKGLAALAYKASLGKSDVGLGNVENTALSTWAGSTNITKVGTIATGTWQGTAVAANYIGNLPASKINSGTFDAARIPTGISITGTANNVTGTVALDHGGTGATSASAARDNLGLGNAKIFYGTCATAAGTTEKEVTCAEFTAADLVAGAAILVTFSTTNSGAVGSLKLDVNSTGAKALKKQYNASAPANLNSAGELQAGNTYLFIYNAAYNSNAGAWVLMTADYNNTYSYDWTTGAAGNGRTAETSANGGVGIHRYTLQMMTSNLTWSSLASDYPTAATTNGAATNKTVANCAFLLGSPILYQDTNANAAPGNSANVNGYTTGSLNLQYSTTNAQWTALTIQKPVYLVATPLIGGTFRLDTTKWWTQTLPTSDDGNIYIFLGMAYSATNIYLHDAHPIYEHNGTSVVPYVPSESPNYLKLSGGTLTGAVVMDGCEASGKSTAFGFVTKATGFYSNSEGYGAQAIGGYSHAEGQNTIANEVYSHAEGKSTTANGQASHAEGFLTYSNGQYSHAEGVSTYAYGVATHVSGRFNSFNNSDSTLYGPYAEIVGNGASNARSNARTLDWSGNEWISGSITASKYKGDGSGLDNVCIATTVWENASPASSFAAQTIALTLTLFNAIIVQYSVNGEGSTATYNSVMVMKNESGGLPVVATSNDRTGLRTVEFDDNGVTFGATKYHNATNNAYAVPLRIIGVKGITYSVGAYSPTWEDIIIAGSSTTGLLTAFQSTIQNNGNSPISVGWDTYDGHTGWMLKTRAQTDSHCLMYSTNTIDLTNYTIIEVEGYTYSYPNACAFGLIPEGNVPEQSTSSAHGPMTVKYITVTSGHNKYYGKIQFDVSDLTGNYHLAASAAGSGQNSYNGYAIIISARGALKEDE